MRVGKSRANHGFTLIELLVVIAIISVLIALLLPAVQASREAARRAHCLNNLVQIAVALQNYESAHEMLPPGVVNDTGPIVNVAKGYHQGWMTRILPYIEQKNAFNKLNFNFGAYDPQNGTVRSHTIGVFHCPSNPGVPTSTTGEPATSSYAGCHNDVEAPIDVKNMGVLYLNSRTRYEDVPDGSSFTIFVAEKTQFGKDLGWMSGTRASLRNTGSSPNSTKPPRLAPGAAPPSAGLDDDDPTAPKSKSGGKGTDADLHVGGFNGFHPGGINCAFGDGSVRFVKDSVSPKVFHRLGNRADGEMISQDEF